MGSRPISRPGIGTLAATLTVIAVLLAVLSAPSEARSRFGAYVGGAATGPGHSFFVGDGLDLVFVDRGRAGTRYRVCWRKRSGGNRRCFIRRTGARGRRSVIFTPAPGAVGLFIVRWSVGRHLVARFRFVNHVGD